MSKHVKHEPTHRAEPVRKHRAERPTPRRVAVPREAVRTGIVFSSLAVAATGVTVATGVGGAPASVSALSVGAVAEAAEATATSEPVARPSVGDTADAAERGAVVSRSSDRREAADPAKVAALTDTRGRAVVETEDLSQSDPRDIARSLLSEFGFSSDQFGCLDSLYTRESNWTVNADNPTSSAYGIPQALPGSKMASAGADWATNPVTQIRWGLGYIQDRYGSPCSAWGHSQSVGWY